MTTTETLLREAGFTAQADLVKEVEDRKRRLTLAYEHYRYVSVENVKRFQDKLKASTFGSTGTPGSNEYHHFDVLAFTPIQEWMGQPSAPEQGRPPDEVLNAVKEAKDRAIFDEFEVAHIQTERVYADPLIFGRINGCDDRFFIPGTEWGNDVKLDDILGEHDG